MKASEVMTRIAEVAKGAGLEIHEDAAEFPKRGNRHLDHLFRLIPGDWSETRGMHGCVDYTREFRLEVALAVKRRSSWDTLRTDALDLEEQLTSLVHGLPFVMATNGSYEEINGGKGILVVMQIATEYTGAY